MLHFFLPSPLQTEKLYGLDHLRALAILLVFFFHYQLPYFGHPAWLGDVAAFGWTGVDLFFVLSGFLISSHLFAAMDLGRSVSFSHFFVKRFFRIIPIYVVVVAIYFLVPAFHEREALRPLWRYLTFTQNFELDLSTDGTFSHAWSLCVEEHFYLVFPLVVIALIAGGMLRRSFWLLPGLIAGGIVLRHYIWQYRYAPMADSEMGMLRWYEYIYYPTYCRLDGLLTGIGIAAAYVFRPRLFAVVARYSPALLIAGIIVLAAAYILCMDQSSYLASVFGFPLISIGYGLLVAGAISPGSILYRMQSVATSHIAAWSYALYLTHKGVIHLIQLWLSPYLDKDNSIMMLVCLASCLIVAWILHKIIERPFMILRQRLMPPNA